MSEHRAADYSDVEHAFLDRERGLDHGWIVKVRSRDFVELAGVFSLVLLALWTPNPMRSIVGWLAFLWIVVATLQSGESATALGLGLSRPQTIFVGCVGCPGCSGDRAVDGWHLHTLHAVLHGLPAWAGFWAYMFWALVQQFILQAFFLLRLLRLLPTKTTAISAAALLFAMAHIPNPLLMVLTLCWGAAACAVFLRYRNLYTLGLAHGLLGLCLAISVPNSIQHQMRVGLGYLRWHAPSQLIHRSQINQMVSTEACVMAEATSRLPSLHALP